MRLVILGCVGCYSDKTSNFRGPLCAMMGMLLLLGELSKAVQQRKVVRVYIPVNKYFVKVVLDMVLIVMF